MKEVRNVCRKNYYEYLTHIQESKYAAMGFVVTFYDHKRIFEQLEL